MRWSRPGSDRRSGEGRARLRPSRRAQTILARPEPRPPEMGVPGLTLGQEEAGMMRPKLFYRASLAAALLVVAMLVVTGASGGGEKEGPAKARASGETPSAAPAEHASTRTTPDHEVGLYIFLL